MGERKRERESEWKLIELHIRQWLRKCFEHFGANVYAHWAMSINSIYALFILIQFNCFPIQLQLSIIPVLRNCKENKFWIRTEYKMYVVHITHQVLWSKRIGNNENEIKITIETHIHPHTMHALIQLSIETIPLDHLKDMYIHANLCIYTQTHFQLYFAFSPSQLAVKENQTQSQNKIKKFRINILHQFLLAYPRNLFQLHEQQCLKCMYVLLDWKFVKWISIWMQFDHTRTCTRRHRKHTGKKRAIASA